MLSCLEHAFTTVELLITMMIVGIMAAFMAPQLGRWLTTVGVDATARELASELQSWRMRAISDNIRYRISFDPGNDTYVVQKDAAGTWQDIGGPKSLPRGINLESATIDPIFRTLGTTPGGTTITLSNAQGRQRKIRLSFAGRVTVE
jgi:Tfp pilus assembly protein FimT